MKFNSLIISFTILLIVTLIVSSYAHGTKQENNVLSAKIQEANSTDSIKKSEIKKSNVSDTLKKSEKNLPELQVEAEQQSMQLGRFDYIPSKREKNISIDAISLLEHIRIPQISVINGVVNSNLGGKINFFINGLPASPQELAGMNMKDVRKVIYLDYPSDACYMGAERVIDFIVTEYEYGGYTKLIENSILLSSMTQDENIASKFNYKKSSFSVFASAKYSDIVKSGSDFTENISLEDAYIVRSYTMSSGKSRINNYPIRLNFSTSKNSTFFSTHLTWHFQKKKLNSYGLNKFNGEDTNNPEYDSRHTKQNALYWSGNLNTRLGKGWYFSASTSVNHHNTSTRFQKDATDLMKISYSIRENVWNFIASANFTKRIGKGSIRLLGQYYSYRSDNDYQENLQEKNIFLNQLGFISANYSLTLSSWKIDAGVFESVTNVKSKNESNTKNLPIYNFNIQYKPDSHNQLGLGISNMSVLPDKSQLNNVMLHTDLYIHTIGNPLIKSTSITQMSLPYTYVNGSMSLGIYSTYEHLNRRVISRYSRIAGEYALLKTYVNSGNCNKFYSSFVYDHSLLRNKLRLYISATWTHGYAATNLMPSANQINARSYLAWYFKNFYVNGNYTLNWGKEYSDSQFEILKKYKSFYFISAGWGNGNFTVAFTLNNIFNKSWKGDKEEFVSPYYSNSKTIIDATYRQRINISLSYTFDYGKKIQRQDISTEGVKTESSIGL